MSSEKVFEGVDFLSDDIEGHPLSLPYFKLHREVLEKFIEHDLSATEQRIYLYLCHNCLIHQGRTFKMDIEQIAAYFKRNVRTVYRSLESIEDAGAGIFPSARQYCFEPSFYCQGTSRGKNNSSIGNHKGT